jgi:hypothetical protein
MEFMCIVGWEIPNEVVEEQNLYNFSEENLDKFYKTGTDLWFIKTKTRAKTRIFLCCFNFTNNQMFDEIITCNYDSDIETAKRILKELGTHYFNVTSYIVYWE